MGMGIGVGTRVRDAIMLYGKSEMGFIMRSRK